MHLVLTSKGFLKLFPPLLFSTEALELVGAAADHFESMIKRDVSTHRQTRFYQRKAFLSASHVL